MIKAILFDIDGVIIKHSTYFEEYLESKGYPNAIRVLKEYDNSQYNEDCDRGLSAPENDLKPLLKVIKWDKSISTYFNEKYEYEEQFIDYELLRRISELRKNGIMLFIASNQNKLRKEFLIKKMGLLEKFNDCFFSCDFNALKIEEIYWNRVMDKINMLDKEVKYDELLFIDDSAKNIETANGLRINTIYCKNEYNEEILEKIEGVLKENRNDLPPPSMA